MAAAAGRRRGLALDTIEERTRKTPRVLLAEAAEHGFTGAQVKAADVIDWLARDYGLGRGHVMALVHVIRNGPVVPAKHVGSGGSHSDPSPQLWLDGRASNPAQG